jgi:serine/threonine protein kinase/tetratricopeptide (TPR) repeat protein
MKFSAGARLGRYEIAGAIGAGGMGEVYRARDTRLGRVVALKVLSPSLAADEVWRSQFESEARAVSAISHPHICTLFDIDSDAASPFLVMEYLAGETLAQRLQRGVLPLDDCLRHGMQLTEAVAAVHEARIVHRDLKPANVMLTASGVKLMDFGIAAPLPHGDEPTTSHRDDEMLGTLPYMAPELLRGERPTTAADLYAIGAILYEMRSGAPPFISESRASLIAAILGNKPPLLRDVAQGAPVALDRIIRRCLAKRATERHASAAELLADLQRVCSDDACHGRKTSRAGRKPRVASVAVLPLASVTPGPDVDFLSDGVTELLISALARLGSIRVISQTSTIRLDRARPLREIAAELRVDYVIEGSVARSGERIRVTARMVHAPSDTHLWSDTYERVIQDILSVQADLAETIACGLLESLTAEERAMVRGDQRHGFDAHLIYLKARFQWNHTTPEAFKESYTLFKQAIEADATYAPAYAGLADWYHRAWLHRVVPSSEALAAARRYAMQALSLDSRSAEAHASLANSARYDWDFRAAQAGYRKALSLSPSYGAAHLWYAKLLLFMGDLEGALSEIGLARECDPLSAVVLTAHGVVLYCGGRYEEAVTACREAIRLQDDYCPAYHHAGLALLEMGENQQAQQALSAACRLRPDHATVVAALAICHARLGDLLAAHVLEDRLLRLAADEASPLSLAELYAALGEHDTALHHLEEAYRQHQAELIGIAVDPLFAPLRNHAAFTDILRRIGLPQTSRVH